MSCSWWWWVKSADRWLPEWSGHAHCTHTHTTQQYTGREGSHEFTNRDRDWWLLWANWATNRLFQNVPEEIGVVFILILTSLLYGYQQGKIGAVRLIKKGSGACACKLLCGGTRLHFTCYCADSGPNQRKMSAPYWETGGFTFLQWKRVNVRRMSFFTVCFFRVSSKDFYVESIDCKKRWTTHLYSLPLKKSEASIVPIGRGHIALIWDPSLRSSERSGAASCPHSCWVDRKHTPLTDSFFKLALLLQFLSADCRIRGLCWNKVNTTPIYSWRSRKSQFVPQKLSISAVNHDVTLPFL